ncbi:MAG: hypothetical protein Gaeavirus1_35 [Gaeavirus sp.]|uniref:Uncharacterized protein n=1 Tax=Gaeavirus sp. TaxID=2487767 RepID=A0A3G4ZYA7_9VIRU|nr:MAG: hypothetical protein Gaeavirus1_35 [Gaeavirus sp.]
MLIRITRRLLLPATIIPITIDDFKKCEYDANSFTYDKEYHSLRIAMSSDKRTALTECLKHQHDIAKMKIDDNIRLISINSCNLEKETNFDIIFAIQVCTTKKYNGKDVDKLAINNYITKFISKHKYSDSSLFYKYYNCVNNLINLRDIIDVLKIYKQRIIDDLNSINNSFIQTYKIDNDILYEIFHKHKDLFPIDALNYINKQHKLYHELINYTAENLKSDDTSFLQKYYDTIPTKLILRKTNNTALIKKLLNDDTKTSNLLSESQFASYDKNKYAKKSTHKYVRRYDPTETYEHTSYTQADIDNYLDYNTNNDPTVSTIITYKYKNSSFKWDWYRNRITLFMEATQTENTVILEELQRLYINTKPNGLTEKPDDYYCDR